MIESLILKNFQKHKRRKIKLDPVCTVIVGPNGAGKSTLLRALEWTALNTPGGNPNVPFSTKEPKTALIVDGHKIKRTRKPNRYMLDGKRFAAFGTGKVPPEISNLLKLDHVNFQGQLDSPFWFLATPGQVGRELNQIINLDSIDRTLERIGADLRQARSEQAVIERRLDEADTLLELSAWAVAFAADLRKLTKKLEKSKMPTVAALSQLLADVQAHVKRLQRVTVLAVCTNRAYRRGRETAAQQRHVKQLYTLLSELSYIKESTYKRLDVSALESMHSELRESSYALESLASLTTEASNLKAHLCKASQSAKAGSIELRKLTKNRCPLCGRTMTSSASAAPVSTCPTKHRF